MGLGFVSDLYKNIAFSLIFASVSIRFGFLAKIRKFYNKKVTYLNSHSVFKNGELMFYIAY